MTNYFNAMCIMRLFTVVFLLFASVMEIESDLRVEIPTFWPPWESSKILNKRRWETIEKNLRLLIEFPWRRGFHDDACDLIRGYKIIPVYFWPGEQVKLRCSGCKRSFSTNGYVKKWRVLHQRAILRYVSQQETNIPISDWISLGAVSKNAEVSHDTMPTLDANKRAKRVKARFFQTSGYLIIEQASPGIQGIYNCYDDAFAHSTDYVYAVMAMTPYIYMRDSEIKDGWRKTFDSVQCKEAQEKLSFAVADLTWQWKYFPTVWTRLINIDMNERDHTRFRKLGGRVSKPSDSELAETIFRIGAMEKQHPEPFEASVQRKYEYDLNLLIGLDWATWSDCTGCSSFKGRRTRQGHCTIRKIDPTKGIDAHFKPKISSPKNRQWLQSLDQILSMEPFDKQGIRLGSSLIAGLITNQVKENQFLVCDGTRNYGNRIFYGALGVFMNLHSGSPNFQRLMLTTQMLCMDAVFISNEKNYFFTGYFFQDMDCRKKCD